jgi:hypothetical protein
MKSAGAAATTATTMSAMSASFGKFRLEVSKELVTIHIDQLTKLLKLIRDSPDNFTGGDLFGALNFCFSKPAVFRLRPEPVFFSDLVWLFRSLEERPAYRFVRPSGRPCFFRHETRVPSGRPILQDQLGRPELPG